MKGEARQKGRHNIRTNDWQYLIDTLEGAVAHFRAGRLQQAETVCHNVLEHNPDNADALHILGVIAWQKRDCNTAIDLIKKAIAVTASNPTYHNSLGNVLKHQGKLDDARGCYREALRLKPDFAEAHFNLGVVLKNQRRTESAIREFGLAIEVNPDYVEAYNDLGNTLRDLGRVEEAIHQFNQALRIKPDYSEAYNNLGAALLDDGRTETAIRKFEQALHIKPDLAQAHNNLGNAFYNQGRVEAAMEQFEEALRIKPDFADACYNIGNILRDQGEIEAAIRKFEQAIRIRPDYAEAHVNRSFTLLLTGSLAEGWKEYEWRFRCQVWKTLHPNSYVKPRWDGSSFKGKRLFIHDEQGMGDTLQFVRYLPMVKSRGGTVIFQTVKPLVGLLKGFPGIDEFEEASSGGKPFVDFDYYVSLASLPLIFGTILETITVNVPYIRADFFKTARWRDLLAGEGLKVGIVWAGKPKHTNDHNRSCPLKCFAPLAEIPDVRLYGLQKGEAATQVDGLSKEIEVTNLGEEFEDFTDTAGAIENMDLVISVDTSVAHLAGAMGKPVWVLLPFIPDWRWLMEREDSPWYPTMRLFRQPRQGDWEAVFQRVVKELFVLAGKGSSREESA